MIGRLSGLVVDRDPAEAACLLDVNGVGYEVFVPVRSLTQLPTPPEAATVHVHTHVREEALTLYGFSSLQDRSVFRTLLGVSGVGPRLAMAIVGDMTAEALYRAVVEGDRKRLGAVSGVGKKLAARLALELKDKVPLPEADALGAAPDAPPPALSSVAQELALALTHLGFPRAQAEQAALRVTRPDDQRPMEHLLRLALATLG
ncbi:MAG: Holliday junction branch migration protein RuvA [Myxococcales bacterium]|nr:Holliday junction branch migration protein RuvA [Myxococcales bacterium]MDD9971554.1 Holliday junction branch migration protein RuvA [Myxococcales bacterium]